MACGDLHRGSAECEVEFKIEPWLAKELPAREGFGGMQVIKQARRGLWLAKALPAMVESGGMQVIKQVKREVWHEKTLPANKKNMRMQVT